MSLFSVPVNPARYHLQNFSCKNIRISLYVYLMWLKAANPPCFIAVDAGRDGGFGTKPGMDIRDAPGIGRR